MPDGIYICLLFNGLLGARAMLSHLDFDKSPEAQVGEAAFRSVRERLGETLLNYGSGRELCGQGYQGTVLHAARVDHYGTVPWLAAGRCVDATAGPALTPS
jgi:hypothetical protein